MRKTLMLVGIPVAVVGVAVAVAVGKYGHGAKSNDKFAEDLQRAQAAGLDLAQAQGANKYALTEIAPEAKPLPSTIVRQGNGAKAIRSQTPTVKAAPEPTAAAVVDEMPQVHVIQTAATPEPTEVSAPAVPRPVAQTMPASGSDQGPILAGGTGRGTGSTGGGIGLGGIFGAIIRGGGVDGDNCDPRPGNGARPPVLRSPIYAPRPGGMSSNPTGMGGARVRPGMQMSAPVTGGVSARPRR